MQVVNTANLTPMQRLLARRGALADVQQEINKRLTRFLWTCHSEPSSITPERPQGGIMVVSALKNVEGGILQRCLVTPVITAAYKYRLDLVPEGLRRRERISQAEGSKVRYAEVDEYAGDVVEQLLRDYGTKGDAKANSGLIELAPDRLPHMLDEEVAALRIDEVFFPNLVIPEKNMDVLACVSEQLSLLEDGTHWIRGEVDAKGLQILIRIGRQMQQATRQTQIWQDNVCRRANIALTSNADDEKFKPDYDELDRLCFARTGNQMVETATKVIGNFTTAPRPVVEAPPAAAPVASAPQNDLMKMLAESQAMMAQVLANTNAKVDQIAGSLASLAVEAEATPEEAQAAKPARSANGKFQKAGAEAA